MYGDILLIMAHFRISEAAALLGVSDDTVRRWVDRGLLDTHQEASGPTRIDGPSLAAFAKNQGTDDEDPFGIGRSARNRFVGLVTDVVSDTVMSQVAIQSGQHRVVSLMSTEAVRDLGLEPGMLAVAVVKSTNVVVETPSA